MFLLVLSVIILIILIILAACKGDIGLSQIFEPGQKRYGRQGEILVSDSIRSVLRADDALFTNVPISYDGKSTELDNVIVNQYGVFIIEVKNYRGRIYGNENDYEWIKQKDDGYGNTFEKRVRNPIKQVKRQIYLLAKYLENRGVTVWVEGYAVLVHGNSPIASKSVLSDANEIDVAIHTPGRNCLTAQQVEVIKKLLSV